MTDIWNEEHLPVLDAAVHGVDADTQLSGIRIHDIAATTGLTDDQVMRALRALESDALVEVRWAMPARAGRVVRVSGEARRIVGVWPTPGDAFARMIKALEAIAENTDDEDTRTRAKKILDGMTGAGRQIGISVATAVVTGQLPGAGA